MNWFKAFGIFLLIIIAQYARGISYTEDFTLGTDFTTPRRSMVNFLANLQDDKYHPERAIKSFNFRSVPGKYNRYDKALMFKRYIDAKGYYVQEDKIPDNPDYVDSSSGLSRYFPFPHEKTIYLEKLNGSWKVSQVTVSEIETLYESAYPVGTSWFLKLLPRQLDGTFVSVHYWKWIGLLYLLVFSIVLFYLSRFVIAELITKILEWMGKEHVALKMLRPVSGPSSWLLIIGLFRFLFPLIQFPVQVSFYVISFIKIAVPVLFVWVVYRMVDILALYYTNRADEENRIDKNLIPLLRKATKVLVVVLGFVFVLQNLDYNVTGVLAGLSIGGLALALAAQDTVKNLIGSIMIYIDKPFQIGDWILGEGIDGTVEQVGFRATRIRTPANSVLYVPNAKLSDMISDNLGMRQYRRFKTFISITYDTPTELIEIYTEGLRDIILKHPHTAKENYSVRLHTFNASSLDILFLVFFDLPELNDEWEAREQLMFDILKLAEILGVRMAFPTQTVHVENFPGQLSGSPTKPTDIESARKKMQDFIEHRAYLS